MSWSAAKVSAPSNRVLKNAPTALPEVVDLIESEDSSESERPERTLEGIAAVRSESLNKRRLSSFSAACQAPCAKSTMEWMRND